MPTEVVTRTVTVTHDQGLHLRPLEMVARTATRFESRIELVVEGIRADAKSIINMMTLGATAGTSVTIEAQGDDAGQAAEVLAELLASDFEQVESPASDADRTTEQHPKSKQAVAAKRLE